MGCSILFVRLFVRRMPSYGVYSGRWSRGPWMSYVLVGLSSEGFAGAVFRFKGLLWGSILESAVSGCLCFFVVGLFGSWRSGVD